MTEQSLLQRLFSVHLTLVLIIVFSLSVGFIALTFWAFDPLVPSEGLIQASIVPIFVALMIASIILFIQEKALNPIKAQIARDHQKGIIESEVDRAVEAIEKATGTSGMGLISIHQAYTDSLFIDLINSGSSMFILQTYSPTIDFQQPEFSRFLGSGGTLEMLIISPESSFVRARCIDLDTSGLLKTDAIKSYSDQIRHNEDIIKRLSEQFPGQVTLHQYLSSPGVVIHGNEHRMFVGSFLQNMHGIKTPQLELSRSGGLYKRYYDHYLAVKHSRASKN